MGLQVWLTLSGNTKQQGLSNIAMTGSPNSWVNGKIGQCAHFAGNADNAIYNNTTDFNYTDNFSWAVWIKTNFTGTTAQYVFTNGRADTGGYGYGIQCVSSANCYVRFGNQSYTIPVTGGEWTHLAFTKKGTLITIYKNGSVHTSQTFNGTLPTYSDGNGLGLGCFHYSGNIYPFYGDINDFRIYDHVLSPREVKEISKGLVLHYPLAMPGGENLLKNSLTNFPELWSGSGDGRTLTTQSGVSVPEWGCNDGLRVYGKSGASRALCLLIDNTSHGLTVPSTSVSGQKYTPSIYIKNNHQNAISIAFNGMGTGQSINQGEIKKVILKATGNGTSYLQFTISASDVNKEYDFTFWHPKIELGEMCTPWVPATTDSLYSAMGLNDGIEYDVSGYERNGVKTNITYSSDTARYNTSSVFNGTSSKITTFKPDFIKDEVTFSFWAYMDNWGNGALHSPVSAVEGGGFGMQGNNTAFNLQVGTGSSSVTWIVYTANGSTLNSGWHHFAGTYDGFVFNAYIDGTQVYTNTKYTTKTPIFYNTNANSGWLFIGGESGSSATNPSNYFNGKISDVRIYSTALSADDILELYHTPISLSNNGTLLTQGEYVES